MLPKFLPRAMTCGPWLKRKVDRTVHCVNCPNELEPKTRKFDVENLADLIFQVGLNSSPGVYFCRQRH